MDFSVLKRIENGSRCYKLLKANFYRGYFVIIAQDKADFYCGSFYSDRKNAELLFEEIAMSNTEPYTVADILQDFKKQSV